MSILLPIAPPAAQALRFVAFATDAHSRSVLAMAAAARGWLAPEIHDGGLEAAHAFIAATAAPAFLVIDLSGSSAPLGAVDALADVCASDTRVLAIGTANDVALYRGLRSLGVTDYLLKPLLGPDLAAAMDAALAAAPNATEGASTPAPHKADVFAFLGPRGGAGVTSIALSTAAILAEDPARRVVFLDFDLQAGSAALDVDAEPSAGLAALLESPDRVDQVLVEAALRPHRLGFSLLTAEEPMDQLLQVKPDAVQALLSAVGSGADVIIVDLPRRLDRAARAVLRTADRVAIVTPMTLAGMRDTQRLVRFVTGVRAGQRPLVIANRCGESTAEVAFADFERGIGTGLDVRLPHAPRVAARAAQQATALVQASGRSPLTTGLRTIAASLVGGAGEAPERQPGWLRRARGWLRGLRR